MLHSVTLSSIQHLAKWHVLLDGLCREQREPLKDEVVAVVA